MSRLIIAVPLALAALAACQGEDPARAERRAGAARAACVGGELAVQAGNRLAAVDTLAANGNPLTATLFPFARGYHDYAKLRERQLALLDSAATAGSTEDSTELATRAAAGDPGRGRPGTPEANAAEAYDRDFASAMGNPSHPCNAAASDEK